MRTFLSTLFMLAFFGGACAHRQADPADVVDLKRTIESLRAQNGTYAKQVEELENRLFILTDRLDSQKVNQDKVASVELSTVTLHPDTALATSTTSTQTELAPDEPEVEYAGEAARSSTQRPVLRLHGDTERVAIERESSRTPLRSLPVVREGSTGKSPSNVEAMRLYHQSYQKLREGKHSEAAEGFRSFLRQFSGHDLADNAQYWLGECFYDRKDFSVAVREFRRVIERHPLGNKVPDALLKVGFSYLALGSIEVGRQTLEQVQRSYPRHEAAVLAATRLSELEGYTHPETGSSLSRGTAHLPKEVP